MYVGDIRTCTPLALNLPIFVDNMLWNRFNMNSFLSAILHVIISHLNSLDFHYRIFHSIWQLFFGLSIYFRICSLRNLNYNCCLVRLQADPNHTNERMKLVWNLRYVWHKLDFLNNNFWFCYNYFYFSNHSFCFIE